jgi:uncharacterized protein YjdB
MKLEVSKFAWIDRRLDRFTPVERSKVTLKRRGRTIMGQPSYSFWRLVKFVALSGLIALGGCIGDGGSAAPTLQSIEVTSTSSSIAAGTSIQLAATAIYSDSSHADVTNQVAWSSSNPAVATVDATSSRATAVNPGSATLSATLNGQSGSTTLTVTAATVVSIAITPASPSIAAGTTQQFVATGTLTDNSTQNISADVGWTSSSTTVATVNGAGLASSLSAGQTIITANCTLASMCGTVSATAALNVSAATLVSIAVTPTTPSIALGTTQQFVATGTYTDNTTQNLSAQASWSSSNTTVASVNSAGLATSAAIGRTNIAASVGSIASAPVPLGVTAATLASIAVSPTNANLALGYAMSFSATGTYTDGSTQSLTSQVTWTSSAGGVATISNASNSAGVATSVAQGSTNITASMSGVTSAPAALTISAPTLLSITITPANAAVLPGSTLQYLATGNYSDTSTGNITSSVTWLSDTPATAAFNNSTAGLVSAIAVGSANISASLNGQTATTGISVEATAFSTPGLYTWIVPAGVTSIQIVATGGGGGGTGGAIGNAGSAGGNGAIVTSTLTVNPGDSLSVSVGGGGGGGGPGLSGISPGGGGGGGSSSVIVNRNTSNAVVAGGGGGGAYGSVGGNAGSSSSGSPGAGGAGGAGGGFSGVAGGAAGTGSGYSGGSGSYVAGGGGGGAPGGAGGSPDAAGAGGGSYGPAQGTSYSLTTNAGAAGLTSTTGSSGANGSIVITIQ